MNSFRSIEPEDHDKRRFVKALVIVSVIVLAIVVGGLAISETLSDEPAASTTTTRPLLTPDESEFLWDLQHYGLDLRGNGINDRHMVELGHMVAEYIQNDNCTLSNATRWLHNLAVHEGNTFVADWDHSIAITNAAFYNFSDCYGY